MGTSCRQCGTENAEARRFCAECGAALPRLCPDCGFANEPRAKFCGGCGTPLVSRAAPQEAAPAEAERRQLTVLFCDLVDSTGLAAKLDPEDLREVMRAFQDTCAETIARFGGHIARYMGDGVLALFGFPRALEEDPARAVHAGLELVAAVGRLAGADGAPLAARVGIATGLVVVGDVIGEGVAQEEAVVGETPNLAARLQALAEPGQVVIAPATRDLVGRLFDYEDLGECALKGFDRPLRPWRVIGRSAVESRYEARQSGGPTPMMGRDREAALLLERWELAKDGDGQVMLLCGEPGIGKSRIVRALVETLGDEPHTRLRYYCSPYFTNTALYPVIEQIERVAGLDPREPPGERLDKLERLLAPDAGDLARVMPLFADLLSIPCGDRYPPLDLTPQEKKSAILAVLVDQLGRLAERGPVLMVCEDAHWIDPTTQELLDLTIERAQRLPILLVVAYRPDFRPSWTHHAHVTALALNRLTRRYGAAMVDRLTGGKALPEAVLDQILSRTDGVPLFVEELTKAVLESGLLRDAGDRYLLAGPLPALAIPDSLQDSLLARLDRLGTVKELAQLAATVGRSFSYQLLAAVSHMDKTALDDALTRLEDSELVYRRGLPPDLTYEFKHALVQGAAYSTLLRGKRQQLHLEIARVLEERFPHVVEGKPELLAHHFGEAADTERAQFYAERAGDAAAARYAPVEARARYQSALEMARSRPPGEEVSRGKIGLILKLAGVALNREDFERDLNNLDHARALAEQLGDNALLGQVVYWMGRTNYVLGRFDSGVAYAERALRLAEELDGGDAATAPPVNLLARLHCLLGEPRKAADYGARNVEQMRRLGNRMEEAAVSGVLAFAYGTMGDFPRAFAAADHGVALAETIDHLPTVSACHHFRGVVHGWRGDIEASCESFARALELCERSKDVFRQYLVHGWRGQAHLLAGDKAAAKADLVCCVELGTQIGTSFHRGAFQAFLAKILLLDDDVEAASAAIGDALTGAAEPAQAWSRSIALRIKGEVLLRAEPRHLFKAEDAVRAAIEIQEERECRCDLAWSRLALCQVLAAKGDLEGAATANATAARLFEEIGFARGAARADAALEGLRERAEAGDGPFGERQTS